MSSSPNPFIAIMLGLLSLPVYLLRIVFAALAGLVADDGGSSVGGRELRCSAGHVREIRASDRYKCGCGAIFQGVPDATCPVCGEGDVAAVTCDCGLAIPLPGRRLPRGSHD